MKLDFSYLNQSASIKRVIELQVLSVICPPQPHCLSQSAPSSVLGSVCPIVGCVIQPTNVGIKLYRIHI